MSVIEEEKIVQIFKKILSDEDVATDSNFFESGGDSLLATRVLSAIAREYSVELTVGDLYEYPCPSSLSAHLTGESV